MPTQCKLQRDHSCGKLANDTIATGIAKIKENVFIRNRTTLEKQKRQTSSVPLCFFINKNDRPWPRQFSKLIPADKHI
jgi:hypothetical protein